ncbi:MAG: 4'-phosphopantetheinyl transferase superfamily protein [Propionibacteriaceae bacterium]|nr:4'-phosphopantetheinyl transferase superfamily protein [Propionibacteriaceae bacterium]
MARAPQGTVLSSILPAQVVCAEEFSAGPSDSAEAVVLSGLFDGERSAIAGAVPRRQAQFAAGRRCARAALGELGREPSAILPGARREPVWPDGVVGSITHCAGYCAAAVASQRTVWSLGIDAEAHEPLPEGVLEVVSDRDERALLRQLARTHPAVHWCRVLFSAKESIYKAVFPITRRWLGFDDATLTWDIFGGSFRARLNPDAAHGLAPGSAGPPVVTGRFAVHGELIMTAVVLAPPGRPTG